MSVKSREEVVVLSSPGKVSFPRLELERIMGPDARPGPAQILRQSQEPSRSSSVNPKSILKVNLS